MFVSIAISGSKLWETGWQAVRLGVAVFIVPIAFVLDEGLLLHGSAGKIAWAIATAFVGAYCLACALQGFAAGPLPPWRRLAIGLGGVLLIGPGLTPPLIGAALAGLALVPFSRRQASLP